MKKLLKFGEGNVMMSVSKNKGHVASLSQRNTVGLSLVVGGSMWEFLGFPGWAFIFEILAFGFAWERLREFYDRANSDGVIRVSKRRYNVTMCIYFLLLLMRGFF